jgi:hypothetical protein
MRKNSREKKRGQKNSLGFYKNPKLKGLKKQEGKKQLFETVILRTCVVFLLFP